MKKKPGTKPRSTSSHKRHAEREVDFTKFRVRRNPSAKRIAREGIELVHQGPSRSSLREIPEADFSKMRVRRNPYAERVAASGVSIQMRPGRPRRGKEVGPTVLKSVRLPPSVWTKLEKRARAEGVAVHALVRKAILELLERVA